MLNIILWFKKYILTNKKKMLIRWCGAKELSNPGPLYTKPKANAMEEETLDDKQRESKLPRDIAENNPIIGQLRS